MKLNIYNRYRCHCGAKAEASFGDGTANKEGYLKLEYYCLSHFQAVLRLFKLWEAKNYQNTTNAHGMTYMKPREDFESFHLYVKRRNMPERVQTELF